MRLRSVLALALLATVSAACGAARYDRKMSVPVAKDGRSRAVEHVEFGIAVAKSNIWREATLQWEKAVKLDPTYAAAWNNLGIGYEQLGKFKEAREAYEEALKLDPDNTFIRNNYDQFREIYDRQNRRRER
jgi:Flp pilus assembly protein TadD